MPVPLPQADDTNIEVFALIARANVGTGWHLAVPVRGRAARSRGVGDRLRLVRCGAGRNRRG